MIMIINYIIMITVITSRSIIISISLITMRLFI